jgi:ribosomal protein S18 acetylase RimI-like enzyme
MFMNHEIVQLEASQIQAAIEVLGDAFKDDPVFRNFAFQNDRRRLGAIQWISRLMLKYAHNYNTVYITTEELKGVAIWIPPDQFPLNDFRLLLLGAYALPFKFRLGKLLQFISLFLKLEELHKANAPQPHWYLLMLGVHPCYQSQGIGSFLIQPILEKADREGIPCYLETSTEGAVRFYQRHSFEVVKTINFPQESFQIWTMRREPRLKIIDNAS